MSRHSKGRRTARRKQQPGRPIRRLGRPLQPHAHLRDDHGHVVGGGGLREHEWLLVLGGQVVTATESPALLLALLHHVKDVHARAGRALALDASPVLLAAANAEAAAHGHALDAYVALLQAERAERLAGADATDLPGPADTQH